ncbi:hypothetical protein ADUPG1_003726, partial [Aduncisulcus paluster]
RLQKRYEEKRKSSSKRHSSSSGYQAGAANKDSKHSCEYHEDYIEMDWARAQSKILVRNQEGQEVSMIALMDTGSNINLLSSTAAEKYHLLPREFKKDLKYKILGVASTTLK